MAYTKKISIDDLIKLTIDKELEMAGADVRYDDLIAMPKEKEQEL